MRPVSGSRPNLLFIMSDDHAAHAIGTYGSRINRTPHIDRIADGGMTLTSCFCTNSICTPSRAAVLTGTYNHTNGVTTLHTPLDNRLPTFPQMFRAAGYQTAMVGKWHLGHGPRHDPTGFDFWRVLPGQGHYHNPVMLGPRSDRQPGYDVIERERLRDRSHHRRFHRVARTHRSNPAVVAAHPSQSASPELGAEPRALLAVCRRRHTRTRHPVR